MYGTTGVLGTFRQRLKKGEYMCTLAIGKKVYNVVHADMPGTYDMYCNGVLEEYNVEPGFIIGYFSQVLRTELK